MKPGDKVRITSMYWDLRDIEGVVIGEQKSYPGHHIIHVSGMGELVIHDKDLTLLEETMDTTVLKTTVSLKELVDAGICARGLLYALETVTEKTTPWKGDNKTFINYQYDLRQAWPFLNSEAKQWLNSHGFGVEQEYKPKQDVQVYFHGEWVNGFIIYKHNDGEYFCTHSGREVGYFEPEEIRPIKSK